MQKLNDPRKTSCSLSFDKYVPDTDTFILVTVNCLIVWYEVHELQKSFHLLTVEVWILCGFGEVGCLVRDKLLSLLEEVKTLNIDNLTRTARDIARCVK